jgi:hypothetical protein
MSFFDEDVQEEIKIRRCRWAERLCLKRSSLYKGAHYQKEDVMNYCFREHLPVRTRVEQSGSA